ncbi:zincin-like metallopeptidase domain-containing protein [Peribacillus frigoritolerans]|nr:zincin-like metallopeptidase domain-containing protein [Peribacillus frigoritolerans]
MLDGEDKNTGKETKIPLLRYYRVFEINTQVEGLQSKRNLEETFEHDPIEAAENIVKGYINSPSLSWERVGAWYKPGQDHVNVPPMKDFPEIEKYYSTLFHELTHLDRP